MLEFGKSIINLFFFSNTAYLIFPFFHLPLHILLGSGLEVELEVLKYHVKDVFITLFEDDQSQTGGLSRTFNLDSHDLFHFGFNIILKHSLNTENNNYNIIHSIFYTVRSWDWNKMSLPFQMKLFNLIKTELFNGSKTFFFVLSIKENVQNFRFLFWSRMI